MYMHVYAHGYAHFLSMAICQAQLGSTAEAWQEGQGDVSVNGTVPVNGAVSVLVEVLWAVTN